MIISNNNNNINSRTIERTYLDIIDPKVGDSVGQAAIESLNFDFQIVIFDLPKKEVD